MHRLLILFLGLTLAKTLCCQKSTFENINDAANNLLRIFSKQKNSTTDSMTNSYQQGSIVHKLSEAAPKAGQCRELCIRNYNKKTARVELKSKQTLETTTISVMPKDKSCVFDFDVGIYILQIVVDDKLVKSAEIKILNALELIEIPDM